MHWPGTGQGRLWQDIIGHGVTHDVIKCHMTFLISLLKPLPGDHFDMDTFKIDNDDKREKA